MEKLTVDSLPDGAFVNVQVYLDEKYILLSPDIPVTTEMKNRLKKWDFTQLFSTKAAEMVNTPEAAFTAVPNQEVLEQTIEEKRIDKEVQDYYHGCLAFLNKVFDEFQLKGSLRFPDISEKVKEMKDQVKAYQPYLLSLSDNAVEGVSYNVSHSVKTTFLALALTNTLKLSLHRQIELGMAALLHRIGMLRLPPDLYMVNRRLSPQEKQALFTYPVLSFRILKEANFPMSVALGALEHQEKIDGTGYPRKLTGDKISVYGKIIAVASSYAAAVAARPYKPGMDGHSGLMDLIKVSGGAYDQNILKALVYTLSVYPIGTYVELTNLSKGVVVKTDPERPRNPIIKLLMDPNGHPFLEKPLFQPNESDPSLQIKRTLPRQEQDEIEKLYKTQ